ncbi:hypothetical protein KP509_18G075500 [Ceratopteris richardii]|uniref:Uncharacterized protein n=1 Tax=Ceratopteris richardii TaxID=49495 RepID=A0A8T2ST68_CERRI|nr:hypothetical protein KP509_18G075500 [Ceratopteris richardii]
MVVMNRAGVLCGSTRDSSVSEDPAEELGVLTESRIKPKLIVFLNELDRLLVDNLLCVHLDLQKGYQKIAVA